MPIRQAEDDSPGHHAVSRDWHEDSFVAMLEAIGCSSYGYPEEDSTLKQMETPFAEDDMMKHCVIDAPLSRYGPIIGETATRYARSQASYTSPGNSKLNRFRFKTTCSTAQVPNKPRQSTTRTLGEIPRISSAC